MIDWARLAAGCLPDRRAASWVGPRPQA